MVFVRAIRRAPTLQYGEKKELGGSNNVFLFLVADRIEEPDSRWRLRCRCVTRRRGLFRGIA
jgi:hypothetical protein